MLHRPSAELVVNSRADTELRHRICQRVDITARINRNKGGSLLIPTMVGRWTLGRMVSDAACGFVGLSGSGLLGSASLPLLVCVWHQRPQPRCAEEQ